MPAEASRSGRAGPEPTPDAGRRHAIDRPVRHAPQPTRRRPRFTPPARKDENPPEAIRHPARNDPPREPRKPDGRLHQSSRHRSAEAITVSSLTPELSRPARGEPVGAEAAKRARLERIVSWPSYTSQPRAIPLRLSKTRPMPMASTIACMTTATGPANLMPSASTKRPKS